MSKFNVDLPFPFSYPEENKEEALEEYLRRLDIALSDSFGKLFNETENVSTNGYVVRANVSAYDLTLASMTTNGAWQDWDLSSIIPDGTKLVHISVYFLDDAAGKAIGFRENGSTSYLVTYRYTQVANGHCGGEWLVPVDDNRVIEYICSNTTWSSINIIVRGWWV